MQMLQGSELNVIGYYLLVPKEQNLQICKFASDEVKQNVLAFSQLLTLEHYSVCGKTDK